MTEKNVQIILAQSVGNAESGATEVKNPTLSFGMRFVPSAMSFDVMLILDSENVNKENIHINTWIENVDEGETVSNSTIVFDISGNPEDDNHPGSNISRLQFLNVPFEKEGKYKVVVELDSKQKVSQIFRIYKNV